VCEISTRAICTGAENSPADNLLCSSLCNDGLSKKVAIAMLKSNQQSVTSVTTNTYTAIVIVRLGEQPFCSFSSESAYSERRMA